MQNIHIGRYEDTKSGYSGWVQPEDMAWTLFIDKDGSPSLFVQVECSSEDGKVVHGYVSASLVG